MYNKAKIENQIYKKNLSMQDLESDDPELAEINQWMEEKKRKKRQYEQSIAELREKYMNIDKEISDE